MSTAEAYCAWVVRLVSFCRGDSYSTTAEALYKTLRELVHGDEKSHSPRSIGEMTRRLTRHSQVILKKTGIQIQWGPGSAATRKIRFLRNPSPSAFLDLSWLESPSDREETTGRVYDQVVPDVSKAILPGMTSLPEGTASLLPDMKCHEPEEVWPELCRRADLLENGVPPERKTLRDGVDVLVWWEFPGPKTKTPALEEAPSPSAPSEPVSSIPEEAPSPSPDPLEVDEDTAIRTLLDVLRKRERTLAEKVAEKRRSLSVLAVRVETVRVLLLG